MKVRTIILRLATPAVAAFLLVVGASRFSAFSGQEHEPQASGSENEQNEQNDEFKNQTFKWFENLRNDDTQPRFGTKELVANGYRVIYVFEEVLPNRLKVIDGPKFLLRPRKDSRIQDPDCGLSYSCSCFSRYSYLSIPISDIGQAAKHLGARSPYLGPGSNGDLPLGVTQFFADDGNPPPESHALRQEIEALTDTALYAPYNRRNQLENFQMERRARFVKRLSSSDIKDLHLNLGALVPVGQTLEFVWVEGAVRVNEKGVPIELPSINVRPLAIKTKQGLYVTLELIFIGRTRECALAHVFTGRVFDLSKAKSLEASNELARNAVAILTDMLQASFHKEPILADLSKENVSPPGELLLAHDFKSSKVIGAPYFEEAQYLLKWWRADTERLSPPEYVFSKGDAGYPGTAIFLQVSQVITISVGINGNYREVTPQQSVAYKDAVSSAVRGAIASACDKLGGSIRHDGVCALLP